MIKGRLCHQQPIRGMGNKSSAGPTCLGILRGKSSARSSPRVPTAPPPQPGCSPQAQASHSLLLVYLSLASCIPLLPPPPLLPISTSLDPFLSRRKHTQLTARLPQHKSFLLAPGRPVASVVPSCLFQGHSSANGDE